MGERQMFADIAAFRKRRSVQIRGELPYKTSVPLV